MGIKESIRKRLDERKEKQIQEKVENERLKVSERKSYLTNKEKYVKVRGAQRAKADVFRAPMHERALSGLKKAAGRYGTATHKVRLPKGRQQQSQPSGGMLTGGGYSHYNDNPFSGVHEPKSVGSNPFSGIFQPPQRKKKQFRR